jgi:hypothetical protein
MVDTLAQRTRASWEVVEDLAIFAFDEDEFEDGEEWEEEEWEDEDEWEEDEWDEEEEEWEEEDEWEEEEWDEGEGPELGLSRPGDWR